MPVNLSFNTDPRQEKLREEYGRWRTGMVKEEAGFFALYQDFEPFVQSLSAGALRVYLYIGLHSDNWTGESWHGIDTMAKVLHMDPRTIRRALHELVDKQLIARIQATPRGRTFTYLLPLPRTRPLMGKALKSAAEAMLDEMGFVVVEREPLVPPRRKADLLVQGNEEKLFLVVVKYRFFPNEIMTWGNAARRANKGLIVVTSEPWPETVATVATDWGVLLLRATSND